jgi:hypothetical protein
MLKKLSFVLVIVAYFLLYPGLTQPLLELTAEIDQADLANIGKDIIVANPDTPEIVGSMAQFLVDNMEFEGAVEAYNKSRSIIGTIEELYLSNNMLVAFLVALFSIIIPVIKGLLLLASAGIKNPAVVHRLDLFGSLISKWSMADVFVIAVFVAYLAANAIEKEAGLLTFHAVLGPGFYYFLGFCLLSILGSQLQTFLRKTPEDRTSRPLEA